ncbi:MAG TPA: ABC transporter ATP-binding protein [Gemmatimonadota bacterium]|nr:ABC transporter ATP-binding protein [Gemmatimonadota bacterium]
MSGGISNAGISSGGISSTGTEASIWRAEDLSFRYPGARRDAVSAAALTVGPGEIVALVGPNGAGKSTLLKLLVGALEPDRGRADFRGRRAAGWAKPELARRVGVLPQQEEPAFPLTVRELVAMGRYPHLGPWRRERPSDREAIARALSRCRVADLAHRPFATLSGGERQRVRLARALAQEPEALALDEPTASLDVAHEMELWEILKGEAAVGRAVLLTTHNLNLAARYADRLALLSVGRVAASGSPAAVFTEATIAGAYQWPVRIVPLVGPGPDAGAPQIVPVRDGRTRP